MNVRAFVVVVLAFLFIFWALEKSLGEEMPTVDVALVLAADVSASMKADEVEFQRKAYASALTHGDIWSAVEEGPHQRILVSYFEWSDCNYQAVTVRWTVVDSPDDLAAVAKGILEGPVAPYSGVTCIASALQVAGALLATAPEVAERRVVDVSGDGTENAAGIDVLIKARDALVASGVTINGLPILIEADMNLEGFYGKFVVGGPAGFLIPVSSLGDLEPALRRKLVQEIG
jgi:hypothetical protein